MRSSVLLLVIGAGMLAAAGCQRDSSRRPPPLPQVSGALTLGGLSQPVRIVRDRWGVPHIVAQNQDDLFFAQGFVQAQDRLFQMDLWRRSALGRLAEVLGPNFVERDAMTRRVQYRGDPASEWGSYGPDTKAIAESFVRGVNAWVAIARRDVPEEFRLAGWAPDFWTAEDLLNRTDAFTASADAALEVFRAQVIAKVGERRANALFPSDTPYRVPPGLDVRRVSYVVGDALRRVGTSAFFVGLASPMEGSNAWAVNASRSGTGAPLLASDPHRAFAHPSLRYLVHLRAPGWNVIGATSPWLPGVAVGHNERVAWGLTTFPADTQDLYVERVNPSDVHLVEVDGAWARTTIVRDPILIRGAAKPFEFEREMTRHGPIIASDREGHLAYALRWSGVEAGTAPEFGALVLNRAQSSSELREALASWKMPVVDVVYADVAGTIGRQVAGLVPVRPSWGGALPVPGWTEQFEWQGWRRFQDLPGGSDPASGVVFAANRDKARTGRLTELFSGHRAYTLDDFKRMQHDTVSWNAGRLVPLLAKAPAVGAEAEQARRDLIEWNRNVSARSSAAALYVAWERALSLRLVRARLDAALADERAARNVDVVDALTRPSRDWFDGDVLKARNRLLADALQAAVEEVRPPGSGDRTWGRLHSLTFRHALAVTDAGRRRFNLGPFEQSGYAGTVMSTYGSGFDVDGGASFRQVLDLGDWDRSAATSAPGQSERPASAHFADLARLWAVGDYFPLAFTERAVQEHAESSLTLIPAH